MESNLSFIKRRKMKTFIHMLGIAAMCMLVSSCEILCQAGTGTCGISSEQAQRLLHPKAYGEYWTKPGMSVESWRRDWVACGGRSNGDYTTDTPPGSDSAVTNAASQRISRQLGSCMALKGYEYRYTGNQ